MPTAAPHGHAPLPDGGQLYYESQGRGDPVVLIHGGHLDHRMWAGQVGALAAEFHVVAYDVRGFGKSSPKDRPHQAHRDLLELLDHLGVTDRAHLVGLSLGGRIAIDFALTCPDRVRSLVLAAPGLSGWDWHDDEWESILLAMRSLPDPACARSAAVEVWLASPYMAPAMQNPNLRAVLREWTTDNVRDLLLGGPETDNPLDPPAVGRATEVTAPTLLLVGACDVDDIKKIVNHLAGLVGGARVVEFPKVGHMLNLEAPDRFNHEVLTFLRTFGSDVASCT